ncbi:MAG: hypothetical protein HKN88_01220 [Gammaproteobacteria bacterium]|nr:hypothetical protein [Gammaproteobacteria bacterium]NNC96669.1 hypothetical protein [Gammaproteobacteria bacterium]NNM13219.1 hypothetical protein [Gammaproteobacteria bacterium]
MQDLLTKLLNSQSIAVQITTLVSVVIAAFLPAILLFIGAIKVRKRYRNTGGILLAIGAVLLAIVTLDFIIFYVLSMKSAEVLAQYALISYWLNAILNWCALILIAAGLINIANSKQQD